MLDVIHSSSTTTLSQIILLIILHDGVMMVLLLMIILYTCFVSSFQCGNAVVNNDFIILNLIAVFW